MSNLRIGGSVAFPCEDIAGIRKTIDKIVKDISGIKCTKVTYNIEEKLCIREEEKYVEVEKLHLKDDKIGVRKEEVCVKENKVYNKKEKVLMFWFILDDIKDKTYLQIGSFTTYLKGRLEEEMGFELFVECKYHLLMSEDRIDWAKTK